PMASIPPEQCRIGQPGEGSNLADRHELAVAAQLVDTSGPTLCRFRYAIYAVAIAKCTWVRVMSAIVQQHRRRGHGPVSRGDRNNAAKTAGQWHLLAKDPARSRPRERIGKVART